METIDFNQVIQENISVVEGLLPKVVVVYGESDNPYTDANVIKECCLIYTGNNISIANLPPNSSSSGGILETIEQWNGTRGIQRWTNRGSGGIWVRACTGVEKWEPWFQV